MHVKQPVDFARNRLAAELRAAQDSLSRATKRHDLLRRKVSSSLPPPLSLCSLYMDGASVADTKLARSKSRWCDGEDAPSFTKRGTHGWWRYAPTPVASAS